MEIQNLALARPVARPQGDVAGNTDRKILPSIGICSEGKKPTKFHLLAVLFRVNQGAQSIADLKFIGKLDEAKPEKTDYDRARHVIDAIRRRPENPYGTKDEEIASAILENLLNINKVENRYPEEVKAWADSALYCSVDSTQTQCRV